MRIILIAILSVVIVSCNNNKTEKTYPSEDTIAISNIKSDSIEESLKPKLKKYLYVDNSSCVHYELDGWYCAKFIADEDISYCKYQGVKRLVIDTLEAKDLEYCCRFCVSDEIYEMLIEKAKHGNSNNTGQRIDLTYLYEEM